MNNSVPERFQIQDSRGKKDFKIKTFNGYKKTEIFNAMQKSILSGNIEKSILWATELHCSGYASKIFERLFEIYIKEINKANIGLLHVFFSNFEKSKLSKLIGGDVFLKYR